MSDEIAIPFISNAKQVAGDVDRAAQATERAAQKAGKLEREQRDIAKSSKSATAEMARQNTMLSRLSSGYDRLKQKMRSRGGAMPSAPADASARNAGAGRIASLAGALGGGPVMGAIGAGIGAAGASSMGVGLGLAAGGAMAAFGMITSISRMAVQAARKEMEIRQKLADIAKQGRDQVSQQAVSAADAIDPSLRRIWYNLGSEAEGFYGKYRDIAARIATSEAGAVGLLEDVSRFKKGNRVAAMDVAEIAARTGMIDPTAILDEVKDGRLASARKRGQAGIRDLVAQIVGKATGESMQTVRSRINGQGESASPIGLRARDRLRSAGAIGRMDRLSQAEGAMRSELAAQLEPTAKLMSEWYREQQKALEAQKAAAEAQWEVAALFANIGMIFGGEGSEEQKLRRMQVSIGRGAVPEAAQ